MPVNYNAFNVDPLPYQQAAMGNFRNAMALRDQRNQDAEMNAMRAQQQQDLQGQRQSQNAFNDRQQVDLQGQRQAQNALGQQQVAETAKRTEVMKQNAKMSSIGTALKLGWEAGGGEASRKVFSGTMAAAGYGDEFGPDSPWVPKFEKDGIGELPIGKGPNGLPEGILTIDGTDKEREAFTDAWIKDPTIVQDQKRLMQAAQDSGVKIGYKKGWSEAKTEPKAQSVADKKFESEKWKEMDDQYVSNYAQTLGIKGDAKEGYYYEGEVDPNTGEPKRTNAGADIKALRDRARRRTAGIKRLSREKQYIGWDIRDLEYEYDQMVAQEDDKRKREAALGKNYAQRGDLKAPKKDKSDVKAKASWRDKFSDEDLSNPIARYTVKDMGSSWTFGKSASEIAAERRRRANQ